MGREANITPEQVHAIADAIKAEGGKPTLRAVRERLGTGSTSAKPSCRPSFWSVRARCWSSARCWA